MMKHRGLEIIKVDLVVASVELLAASFSECEQGDGDQHQRDSVGSNDAADLGWQIGRIPKSVGRDRRPVFR